MQYITLTAHKKCIGQWNFDTLLYYDNNGNEKHSLYISDPGTYTIKYVSGAIISFGYKTLNTFLSPDKQIIEDALYWNRYYETSAVALGSYDLSYFPTSSILLGCFQCQFGTLPGFTENGYKTKELAETMNTYLANNKDKYQFTDTLTFSIFEPTDLIFWYNNINEQEVLGSMTYSIDFSSDSDELFYLNDLSILSIEKNTQQKLSFKNYSYNKNKENFAKQFTRQAQASWFKNIKDQETLAKIYDFNTIGYSSAYLNNIKYSDTLNYNKKYSDSYYWEVTQKVDDSNSKYKFIGKFSKTSPNLLLYDNIYTIFLVGKNQDYIFSTRNISPEYTEVVAANDILSLLYWEVLETKSIVQFKVDKFGFIYFNKLLLDNTEVYIYKGQVDFDELILYIANMQNNNISFITAENQNILKQYYTIEPHKVTDLYNIITYNFYVDASQYLEDVGISTFIIYNAEQIKNGFSFGPYNSVSIASSNIFSIFKLPQDQFKITKNPIENATLSYIVEPNNII